MHIHIHTCTHTLQAVGVPSRLTFLYYFGEVLYPFGPIHMCIWRGQVIYWDKTTSFNDCPLFSWLIILLICATSHATPLSARCWWILEACAEHLLCARFLRHQNDFHLQRASHLVDRHLSIISTLKISTLFEECVSYSNITMKYFYCSAGSRYLGYIKWIKECEIFCLTETSI